MRFHWGINAEEPPPKEDLRFYGIQIGSFIIGFLRFRGGGRFILGEAEVNG